MKKLLILILVTILLLTSTTGCYPNPSFYDVAHALQSDLCSWMQNMATGQIFAYYKVGLTSTGEAIYRWALMTADGTEIAHSNPVLLTQMLQVVNFRIAQGFQYITYFDIDPVVMTGVIMTIITYLPSVSFFVFNPTIIHKFQPTTVPSSVQAYP